MKNTTIEKLERNPIFNMSLHSKELFHSNFWAWLFERNSAYAKIFFSDIPHYDNVEREQGNRDITIWSGENAYIIENKFKSIPRLQQIKEYQSEVGSGFVEGVLTGIKCPDFMADESNWKFISYCDIASKIKEIANLIEKEGFEKELICRYSEMLLELNNIVSDAVNNSSNNWVTSVDFSEFCKIRMDDIVKKLIASDFVTYLKNGFEGFFAERVNDYDLIIESDYRNKHAIADVRYVQVVNKDIISVIGIQVEDGEYRWCIQINKELDETEMNELFEKYVSLGWFEKYDKKSKIIRGKKTGMIKQFGKYCTKDYTFLYQYWKIENSSFEVIGKQIEEDMKLAVKLIN